MAGALHLDQLTETYAARSAMAGVLEEVAKRDRNSCPLLDPIDGYEYEQRVPADVEEIGVAVDDRDTEHVGPDTSDSVNCVLAAKVAATLHGSLY